MTRNGVALYKLCTITALSSLTILWFTRDRQIREDKTEKKEQTRHGHE